MDKAQIELQFRNVQTKAMIEWGAFRRFISAHPLTGFWVGALFGGCIGGFVVWVM